jgi:hypothetical protein
MDFKNKMSKPIIETLINTTALALTAYGTQEIIQHNYYGFIVISFGMILEFCKYTGRAKKLWK